MKKIAYFISLLLTITVMNSCEKHDLSTYEGMDAIYFDQQWGLSQFDSTRQTRQNYSVIPFGSMLRSDSLLSIKIETMGHIYDYDRPFRVEIVPDSTTAIEGEEFEILNPDLAIRAGHNSTRLNIMCHKTHRLDDMNAQIQIKLIPGEHFLLPFDTKYGIGTKPLRVNSSDLKTEYGTNSDPTIHNIFLNNFLVEPARWQAYAEKWLGDYSEKKFRIMLDLIEPIGWTVATFDTNKMWEGGGYITVVRLTAQYLASEYAKGREHWVLDPDGTMMWVNNSQITWKEDTNPNEMVDN